MPTDKELAATYRQIADLYESIGKDAHARVSRSCADHLDPKPTYADGTIAYVTSPINAKFLMRYDADLDQWVNSWGAFGAGMTKSPADVTSVEPLRVLADGEIAIDRAAFGVITTPSGARQMALDIEDDYNATAAAPWLAYSDALKAEAGDRP